MAEWITTHISETVLLTFAALSTIIEISPIKFNPWSAIARAVGKAINKEITEELANVRESIDKHIQVDDDRYAKQCRMRILRFNDEILQGVLHTKEHYDEILDDITTYGRHCETHPGFRNSKAVMAITNIENKYTAHLTDKDFL